MNNLPHILDLPHIKDLLHIFEKNNIEARIVGGAVRDFLLNRALYDIDVAVACPPKVTIEILEKLCAVVPTGLQHGTITAVFEKNTFQITSVREDIKTDGRHAEVIYGTSFEKDAARRDFTINALYMDLHGEIYDYFGGKEDLSSGLIRFIGDPETRIKEDYLRILRFFRMYAYFGKGDFDRAAIHACSKLKEGLNHLSRERIRLEFFKILESPQRLSVLHKMHASGVLDIIHSGSDLSGVEKLAHFERENNFAPRAIRALLCLFKNLEGLSQSFVLTKKEQSLKNLTIECGSSFFEKPVHEILYKLGKENFLELALILGVKHSKNPDTYVKAASVWQEPKFPLSAADLPKLKGKELGDALKAAEKYWIEQEFLPNKQDLIDFVQALTIMSKE